MSSNISDNILAGCCLLVVVFLALLMILSFGDALINNPQGLLRIAGTLGCIGVVIGGLFGLSDGRSPGERLKGFLMFALLGGLIGLGIGAFLVAVINLNGGGGSRVPPTPTFPPSP